VGGFKVRTWPALIACLIIAAFVLAGCMGTPSRDIEQEGADRLKWAQKNDKHAVVAMLSGPERVQPGALVWYSAYGSHDPDFLGATTRDLYDNRTESGGVVYTDDVNTVRFSWYVPLSERKNQGLGTGVRTYEWQVDDGPVLLSYDLTHRYGSEDGPIRFPLGFTEPGTHTLRLTVIGWDGSRDTANAVIQVADDGVGAALTGWQVTEEGWTYDRSVAIAFHEYGECMPFSGGYDEATHRVRAPWDLIYFMESVAVNATWPGATEELPVPLPGLPVPALNTNQVDVTLGHCSEGGAWARFSADQEIVGPPRLTGEVDGHDFAAKLDVDGRRTEKSGAWDFNAYMSDNGQRQGGTGTTANIQFIFVPAMDTSSGGV
jgi:hypothetical protein